MASILLYEKRGILYLSPFARKRKAREVEMKLTYKILMAIVLTACLSILASAQNGKRDKKVPNKPNPPIVIVTLVEKNDGKRGPKKEEPKKGKAQLIGILRHF